MLFLYLSLFCRNVKIEKEATLALSPSFSSFLPENEKGLVPLSFSFFLSSVFLLPSSEREFAETVLTGERRNAGEKERERERDRESAWVRE